MSGEEFGRAISRVTCSCGFSTECGDGTIGEQGYAVVKSPMAAAQRHLIDAKRRNDLQEHTVTLEGQDGD